MSAAPSSNSPTLTWELSAVLVIVSVGGACGPTEDHQLFYGKVTQGLEQEVNYLRAQNSLGQIIASAPLRQDHQFVLSIPEDNTFTVDLATKDGFRPVLFAPTAPTELEIEVCTAAEAQNLGNLVPSPGVCKLSTDCLRAQTNYQNCVLQAAPTCPEPVDDLLNCQQNQANRCRPLASDPANCVPPDPNTGLPPGQCTSPDGTYEQCVADHNCDSSVQQVQTTCETPCLHLEEQIPPACSEPACDDVLAASPEVPPAKLRLGCEPDA